MVTWETIGQDALIVLTLLLLEAVLSFDNAAILAAMVRRLPLEDRRKALLYGLGGAYAMRVAAIFFAFWLIQNPILKVIGGGYLVFLFIRHAIHVVRRSPEQPEHVPSGFAWLTRLGVPALWATIIQIELVDLAFAVDQVVAAVGFTDQLYLIIIASVIGILFLRLAAAVMARVMDWLPLLEHMAYIAVGFVGAKLILDYFGLHVPNAFSISVTLSLFLLPVLVKLIFGIPASRPGEHADMQMPPKP